MQPMPRPRAAKPEKAPKAEKVRKAPKPKAPTPRARRPSKEPTAAAAPTETQQRILEAALELFAERGYDGVTTAAIAARARVAEKTLFANFGTKENLYQSTLAPATVIASLVPEAFRTLQPVFDAAPDDPRELLRLLLRNRISFARAHPRELRLVVQHLLLRPENVREQAGKFAARIFPMVVPLLQRAAARGAVRDDIPLPRLVRIIASVGIGYVMARVLLLPDLDWDDESEIETMVTVLAEGLLRRKS